MVRFLLQRSLVLLARFGAVAGFLVLLIEFSFCGLGGSGKHLWRATSWGPPDAAFGAANWAAVGWERSSASLPVVGLAWGGTLLIGHAWGILGARWRRFRAARWIALPLAAFACVPGFFFVVLVAIYACYEWERPGFADELLVESGPDWLGWWSVLVVALPAMVVGAAWQVRAVSRAVEREAARPLVRGLYRAGYRDDAIFYGNVCRRALPALAGRADRTLPFLLGSLVCLEWAFRYRGMGSLLVESTRSGSYEGILISVLWMAALVGIASLLREGAQRLATVE